VSKHYASIAFTDAVRDVQRSRGSNKFYERKRVEGNATPGIDALTDDEVDYLAERDSFFIATVSQTGWPYVQFRGGRPGFIRVVDPHTIGWADFQGNLQYISVGNVSDDDRVAIIALDFAHKRRLKIYGRARVVTIEDDPDLVSTFTDPEDDSTVERAILVTVAAFDWNCQQHITPRFSEAELQPYLEPMRTRLAELEAENARLRNALGDGL